MFFFILLPSGTSRLFSANHSALWSLSYILSVLLLRATCFPCILSQIFIQIDFPSQCQHVIGLYLLTCVSYEISLWVRVVLHYSFIVGFYFFLSIFFQCRGYTFCIIICVSYSRVRNPLLLSMSFKSLVSFCSLNS